jgi:hypothetical protein
MAASTRLVVLLAVMAVLAGCGSSGFDKAGGSQPRHPVVLTLAYFNASPGELDGFTSNVWRLSGGTMRIAIKYRWRYGQVKPENGLIGDVRPGKADLGVVGGRAWDSVGVDGFRALVAPLLIDSYALQDRVLRSPMIGQMLAVTDDLAAEANVVRGDERADTATLCRRGLLRLVDASPAGLAALRRAVQPVYAQLERDPPDTALHPPDRGHAPSDSRRGRAGLRCGHAAGGHGGDAGRRLPVH